MKMINKGITQFSKAIDLLGGYVYLVTMLLVVCNVIMRTVFKHPILGTIDMVEIFTATAVGLTISYCAVLDQHVSIGFIVEKFPLRAQKAIALVINFLSMIFLAVCAYMLIQHANSLLIKGNVSATLALPYHPFIYIISVGFITFALYMLVKIVCTFIKEGE